MAAEQPTSIRLTPDLKGKLRYMAEKESRTLSVQIVHILKTATEFIRVPRKRKRGNEKQEHPT